MMLYFPNFFFNLACRTCVSISISALPPPPKKQKCKIMLTSHGMFRLFFTPTFSDPENLIYPKVCPYTLLQIYPKVCPYTLLVIYP